MSHRRAFDQAHTGCRTDELLIGFGAIMFRPDIPQCAMTVAPQMALADGVCLNTCSTLAALPSNLLHISAGRSQANSLALLHTSSPSSYTVAIFHSPKPWPSSIRYFHGHIWAPPRAQVLWQHSRIHVVWYAGVCSFFATINLFYFGISKVRQFR